MVSANGGGHLVPGRPEVLSNSKADGKMSPLVKTDTRSGAERRLQGSPSEDRAARNIHPFTQQIRTERLLLSASLPLGADTPVKRQVSDWDSRHRRRSRAPPRTPIRTCA